MFEYKVVPAPQRGLKARGIKGTPARFANALETVMNDMGAQGWEYQRTDTLPVEERQGLTGKTTTFQNMLVFRRAIAPQEDAPQEVAALIEDQTEAMQDESPEPTPEDIAAMAEVETPESTAPHAGEDMQTDAAEAGHPVQDADARVNDTLKATFSMPWNKRATPAATSNDDVQRAAD